MKTIPPFISEVVEEFEKTVENRLMAGNRPLSEEIPWIKDFLRTKLTTLVSEAKREVIEFVKCKEHPDQLCGGCILCTQNESLIKAFAALTTEGK